MATRTPASPRRRAPRAAAHPQPDPSPQGSQDKILEAALAEFADRGFAGARVDRIAASAGVNKAMLYYHFGNKERLYRAVLQRLIGHLGDTLDAIAARPEPAADRLAAFIDAFVRLGLREPRIAPIMLREVAEGAARLDQDTVRLMVRLPRTMGAIVKDGQASGEMRELNPLLAYLGVIWPVMVYLASGPARHAIHRYAKVDISALEPDMFIAHMQDVCARTLAADPVGRATRSARSRTSEHAS